MPGAGRTMTTDWGGNAWSQPLHHGPPPPCYSAAGPHDLAHVLLCSTGQVPASYEEGLVEGQGGGTEVSREKMVHGTIVREIGHQEL